MINLKDISNVPIKTLVKDHYDFINPVKADGKTLKQKSLISKLIQLIDELESLGPDEKEHVQVVKYLLGRNFSRINKIITGSPEELEKITCDFEKKFNQNLIYNTSGNQIKLTQFGNTLKDIFNYERYRKDNVCYKMLNALGFNYSIPCPYCNIDKITIITKNRLTDKDEFERALFDIDHFQPRSRFPFLSVSFFNLIPSCVQCNRFLKKQLDFRDSTHINPYSKSFDEYFKFEVNDLILPFESKKGEYEFAITCVSKKPFSSKSIKELEIIERLEKNTASFIHFLRDLDRFNDGTNTINILYDQNGIERAKLEDVLNDHGVGRNPLMIYKVELAKLKRDYYYSLD